MEEHEDVLEDEDGSVTPITLSVYDWLLHKKRILLKRREKCEVNNKDVEIGKKMLIQDALRSNSKEKIQHLVARKVLLFWETDYSRVKQELRSIGMANW